jgi:hypothetical protein
MRFFDGFNLLPPGLVWASQWNPAGIDPTAVNPESSTILAGLAIKP